MKCARKFKSDFFLKIFRGLSILDLLCLFFSRRDKHFDCKDYISVYPVDIIHLSRMTEHRGMLKHKTMTLSFPDSHPPFNLSNSSARRNTFLFFLERSWFRQHCRLHLRLASPYSWYRNSVKTDFEGGGAQCAQCALHQHQQLQPHSQLNSGEEVLCVSASLTSPTLPP